MDKWEYQKKPCYLENRVIREPCKQRTACIQCLLRRSRESSKKTFIRANLVDISITLVKCSIMNGEDQFEARNCL